VVFSKYYSAGGLAMNKKKQTKVQRVSYVSLDQGFNALHEN